MASVSKLDRLLAHRALPFFALATTVALGCGGADSPTFGNGEGGAGDGGGSAGDTSSSVAPGTTTGPGGTTSSSSATSSTQAGPGPGGTGGGGPGVTGSGGEGQGGDGGAGDGGSNVGGAGEGGTGQGGSGDACGNDTCDDGETCETCEDDCGPCADECDQHDDCEDDQICDDGTCADAFGRAYEFTVVSGVLPVDDPANATPWDPVGLPDPLVEICTAIACPAGTTTTRDGTYTPSWNESFTQTLDEDSEVYFVMWEEDVSADDFALQTSLGSAEEWIDIVRNEGGTYTYATNGLSLTIEVAPQ